MAQEAADHAMRGEESIANEYPLAEEKGEHHGNQTHTANQLRIGSATPYRKLKSYGLIGGKRALRKGAPTRS